MKQESYKGVLIPNIELPTSCKQCLLKDSWHDRCKLTNETWYFTFKGRLSSCPLIEINLGEENE